MARTAREVAEKYVELVNDGQLVDIVDLYAEECELLPPNPAYAPLIRGKTALREHYRRSVGGRKPHIEIEHLYEADHSCVIELRSQTVDEDITWGIVDIFTIDDTGQIVRMAAYRRQTGATPDRPSGH